MRNAIVILAALAIAGCRKSGPPYSPSDALRTFRIEPGYRIELFAAEPDVVSPVAMDFDENGGLYVVENRGYPLNVEGKLGRVKLLRDGKVTIFADRLVMPTSVMRWKNGVLVADAPDVLYLEDTDADGVADVRRPILTGFPFTNPQHTVNGLIYGLDNWIYLAHENATTAIIFKEQFGDRGSDIRFADREGIPPLKERGRNIRFRPDTGELEALSSSSQFGHSFDDWGRHFTVSNSNHVRMEAIPARYLKRNPDVPVTSAVEDISDHGAAAKVLPIAAHPRYELLSGIGEFTSACGIVHYRGSTFVAEPVHGIVHRDALSDAGSLYRARRGHEGAEFLASTDAWFRPVNLYAGPDGALYLIDYYRLAVEHPEWMSAKTYQSPDLYKGSDRGRIWRIVPEGLAAPAGGVRLGALSNSELVKDLASDSIWRRRTAQRLLLDRRAKDATPDLARFFLETQSPQGRVHALWTLKGLGKLDAALVRKALADPVPGVRENGLRLTEDRPEMEADILAMATEADSRVRYQLLLTLGSFRSAAAQSLRERLLFDNLEDKWFQIAALSASSDDAPRLFVKAVSIGGPETKGRAMLFRYLAAEIAARQRPTEIEAVLRKPGWWRAAVLEGLNMERRGRRAMASRGVQDLLLEIFASGNPAVRQAALRSLEIAGLPPGPAADRMLQRAQTLAGDANADADARADAIGLLALAGADRNAALFESMIDPRQPDAVQSAAVRAYGKVKGDAVGTILLKRWRSLSTAARSDAADAMYLEPSRELMLIAALKNGDVQPWMLAFRHKRRLIMHANPGVRDAARPILEQTPAAREGVVAKYEAALDSRGDAAKGREVFRSACAKCHRLEGHGAQVGPDLLTVKNQSKQWMLRSILIPSESIAQGYESYVVETAGSGTLDGVIGTQTAAAITLRHEDGKEDMIRRQDIRNMYVTNLSAMPGDLEKQIGVQEMADLLEYLKTVK